MRSTVEIVDQTEAFVYDLVGLDDLKSALLITNTTEDVALQTAITHWSKVIAEEIGRVFALQDVIETIRFSRHEWGWFSCEEASLRLARWPVNAIDSVVVDEAEIDSDRFDFNDEIGALWLCPPLHFVRKIVVSYSAGFSLPDEAPEKLKQACIQAVRESRLQAQSEGQDINTVRHGDTSVSYFVRTKTGDAGALPPGVDELIASFRRLVLS